MQANSGRLMSRVVNVKIERGTPTIQVFPNPIVNKQINLHLNRQYIFQLSNLQGQQVLNGVFDHIPGTTDQDLPLDKKLPAGYYYLRILYKKTKYDFHIMVE